MNVECKSLRTNHLTFTFIILHFTFIILLSH
jgi:hypothetical protein